MASIIGMRVSSADVHKFAITDCRKLVFHLKWRVVSAGNSDQSKAGDGLKGNNPLGGNKSGDTGSPKAKDKPLDWREFRSLLYIHEQVQLYFHEAPVIMVLVGPFTMVVSECKSHVSFDVIR